MRAVLFYLPRLTEKVRWKQQQLKWSLYRPGRDWALKFNVSFFNPPLSGWWWWEGGGGDIVCPAKLFNNIKKRADIDAKLRVSYSELRPCGTQDGAKQLQLNTWGTLLHRTPHRGWKKLWCILVVPVSEKKNCPIPSDVRKVMKIAVQTFSEAGMCTKMVRALTTGIYRHHLCSIFCVLHVLSVHMTSIFLTKDN